MRLHAVQDGLNAARQKFVNFGGFFGTHCKLRRINVNEKFVGLMRGNIKLKYKDTKQTKKLNGKKYVVLQFKAYCQ